MHSQGDSVMNRVFHFFLFIGLVACSGCGGGSANSEEDNPTETVNNPQTKPQHQPTINSPQIPVPTPKPIPPDPKPFTLPQVSLGGTTTTPKTPGTSTTGNFAAGKDGMGNVLEAMQPLQVFLGKWNTTTSSNKGAGSVNWVWDFRTDKSQPALVMSTKGHPYFENVRLTYLTDKQKYQLTAEDKEKTKRIYEGQFSEKPHQVTGDDGKPEQNFEMKLAEVGNQDARKLVSVEIAQVTKNRVWMKVFQRAGTSLRLQDTVANQRDGTSFAKSDSDYGENECIVSQGLGTTQVSYMGRTYFVCCSGCQAAFTDDPTFWINKAEERKKAMKK